MKFKITFKDKNVWDYINFSSGYRNNYWKDRGNVDIGGSGTYAYNGFRSRSTTFKAFYGYGDLSNVCSGYSAKLWNAYRPSYNSIYSKNNLLFSHNVSPLYLYNSIGSF